MAHTFSRPLLLCYLCDEAVELTEKLTFNCVNKKCDELMWLFLTYLAQPRARVLKQMESIVTDFSTEIDRWWIIDHCYDESRIEKNDH